MKISYVLGYTLSAIWWLFVVIVQLSVPTALLAGVVIHPGYNALAIGLAILAAPLTAWSGGLNTVPSIVWRFRKSLQTRIIERDGSYALQMKVFGGWIYVDGSDGETNSVMTAWRDDLSAYPFILSKKTKIIAYRDRLEQELRDGFNTPKQAVEVVSEQSISREII